VSLLSPLRPILRNGNPGELHRQATSTSTQPTAQRKVTRRGYQIKIKGCRHRQHTSLGFELLAIWPLVGSIVMLLKVNFKYVRTMFRNKFVFLGRNYGIRILRKLRIISCFGSYTADPVHFQFQIPISHPEAPVSLTCHLLVCVSRSRSSSSHIRGTYLPLCRP